MSTLTCTLEPGSAVVVSSTPAEVIVQVVNTSDTIDAYTVSVFGVDPRWVTVMPARPTLFPGESAFVTIRLELPDTFPAGQRQCTVYVASENQPEQFAAMPLALFVNARDQVSMNVDPATVTAGRRAQFGIVVSNHGNSIAQIRPIATDPEELTEVLFEPVGLQLLPDQQAVVRANVSARRPWIGSPKVRVITFHSREQADDAPPPASTTGTFVQRPRIGRLAISLLGLVTAAAVFAAVLSYAFRNVVDEAKVDERVVNEALAKGGASGAAVSVRPATISGTVVSASTGKGIAGVQLQLFRSDNGAVAVGSAATADDGSFSFARLNEGKYRVRLSGAGFGAQWYPEARTFADAKDVEVPQGEPVKLDPIVLSGQAGSVSGTVVAADPAGATATLVVTSRNDASLFAVVATTKVGADGSFAIPDVPTPGEYRLMIEKPGSATASRSISLAPSEQITGLKITLGGGSGLITGQVTANGVPLGGASIAASNGTDTFSTVSLTDGNVGFFALRGLDAAARYTLTVTLAGYRVESRTVMADETAQPVAITLFGSTGSISGRVLGPGGVPLGGVAVNISGGATPVSTSTISAGAQTGSWMASSLDLPGSYTVTFSKPGFVSQTRRVSLDDSGGGQVTGIDAALSASTATVTGLVIDAGGAPVPHATVTLGGGSDARSILSADRSPGRFSFTNVQAGSYTITVDRTGSVSVVQVVTVRAGETASYTLQLGRQASLQGRVLLNGSPYVGAVVKLFVPANFPNGAALDPPKPVQIGTDGSYNFATLTAPADYVVAVYESSTSVEVLDSKVIAAVPGTMVQVPDFTFTSTAAPTTAAPTTAAPTTAAPILAATTGSSAP